MAKRAPVLSPMEVRVLSELMRRRRATSPTDIAERAGLSRPSLYVLLRRLAKRRCVTRRRAQVPGRPEYCVLYAITDKGRKARITFAKNLGLKP